MKRLWLCIAIAILCAGQVSAQKKSTAKAKKIGPPAKSELEQLRDRYIATTKDYKASLQNLLKLYQAGLRKAEQRHDNSQKLFEQGLLSKRDLEDSARGVTDAQLKISAVEQQISGADTQIAQALVEVETEKQMAKLKSARRGGLLQTTSFIRFNGAGHWLLNQAPSIESFFQQTFKRPLPIAVFGQGAIHNQWRLDHRNAMDISLRPDEPEGQALIDFMKRNGIPFSAFRTAIPGVATGPHIHIGMPSHRY
jgi:hypothetical protein